MDKKHTGSYYTPDYLASFISKRVLAHFEGSEAISVLEPSVGDGSFISELNKSTMAIDITAIDINEVELNSAKLKWHSENSIFIKTDFLDFKTDKKFSLVIGNPPYVKKSLLKQEQLETARGIHEKEGLSEVSVKNIWPTFLIKSNTLLAHNGVLAFVLPSELLQVKFAEEVREYLKREFERIEIFTFNDLMFECKGQDTIVLFAYKKAEYKGEFFTNIKSKDELESDNFTLLNNNLLVDSKMKWTHHFLTSDELNFLENLKNRIKTVNDYTVSKPGIVTAANKFFIVDKETEEKYELQNYTKPIIQRGLFVNGSVIFNDDDLKKLEETHHPTKLLQLNSHDHLSDKLKEYLAIGEEQEIPKRYKCSIRNKWYVIPNISEKPEAFFFKRSHHYPKILKNNSAAFVTDSAYKIEMRDDYDLNSLIYSFYNTLTLLFSEIEGRYYGGGVLELTPSEFKKLPIPYIKIDANQFQAFTHQFEDKENIESILDQNDFNILNAALKLKKNEIKKLKAIRTKLVHKRMRK